VNREASEEVRNVLLYDIANEPCYQVEFPELCPNIKEDPDLPSCEQKPCISKPISRKYTGKEIGNFVEEKEKDSCIQHLRKPIYRYSCTECDFLCIDKSKIPSHRKMMHPDSCRRHIWKPVYKYPCTECEFISIHKGELSSHMKKVHGYKCSFCDAILNCRRALERHKEGVHDQVRMHECNLCGHFFDSPQNIRRHHKVIHLGLKECICKYCGYRCSSNQNLRLHIQRNHEKSKEYKCQECDFKTNTKPNLLTHQKRMHSHKAEYKCNICFFSCKSNKLLEKHNATKFHLKNVRNYSYLCYQFKEEEIDTDISERSI